MTLSVSSDQRGVSQEFSLGPPALQQSGAADPRTLGPGISANNELIETEDIGQYGRSPITVAPMGAQQFVLPTNPGFSLGGSVIAVQDRPEYPAGQAQYPAGQAPGSIETLPAPTAASASDSPMTLGPSLLDWDLIEASPMGAVENGVIPFAEPIDILAPSEPLSVGCAVCGSAHLHSPSLTRGQRLTRGLMAALCPCDDCYQPKWDLQQSTAFWIESARPQTRTRFGWDYGSSMMLADRAEYFWARVGRLGPPHPVAPNVAPLIVPRFDFHELSLYTEVGKGGFSFFTTLPYRSLYLNEFGHEAGFADMQVGTKSLVHDSPLLQIAFQMTTHIPSAVARKGLGTQHVSLEPALLFGFRLSQNNFLQAQVAQWIPIGGDPDYAGSLARWGVSWNYLAWSHDPSTQMTTSLELFGWSFQDGAYTDPILGSRRANDETYVYLGPGMRFLFCNKWEFGVGGAFALTERHFAESMVRSQMTMRF